jgi:hypothetical protein
VSRPTHEILEKLGQNIRKINELFKQNFGTLFEFSHQDFNFVKEIHFNSCKILIVSEESIETESKKVNYMNNNVFKFVLPKYKYKTYFEKNLKRHHLIHRDEK